jgi:ATP-dependent RNA helicase DDX5/DBP2
LIKFRKRFFQENPEVARMKDEEIEAFKKEAGILYRGIACPRPIQTFNQAGFPRYLLQTLLEQNYAGPTPVQSACWPCVLQGRDLIGLAQTGSGKTLVYALPAIVHINSQPFLLPGDGPIALFLAPTRELAIQIQEEFDKFGTSSKIRSAAVYGGVSKVEQMQLVSKGAEVIVATPGRLIDFLIGTKVSLARVTYLVLDEADRMLDLGLELQIRAILSQIRPDRQTLMFSATWPVAVQQLAESLLRNPIQVNIGGREIVAADTVSLTFEFCEEPQKPQLFACYILSS